MSRSSVKILWRLAAVIVLSVAAFYTAFFTYFWLSSFWIILIVFLLIWSILKIHRQGEKDLDQFLLAIRQHDFASALPARIAQDYPHRARAYEIINRTFRQMSISRETSQSFREVIVEQVGVGLIGFRTDTGEVTLVNQLAKKMLQRPVIRNISTLENDKPELAGLFRSMNSGERALITLLKDGDQMNLSVIARELVLDGHPYKLFALQNIRSELEAREIDSWIKLINVLTHEIKNSAIPVATLSEAVTHSVTQPDNPAQLRDPAALSQEEWQEVVEGLQTITRRSQRLVEFVEKYGKFTRLPRPAIQAVDVHALLHSVAELLLPGMEGISCQIRVTQGIKAAGDPVQLEQVVINLVKNAADVLEPGQGEILLEGELINNSVLIRVADNGPGIPEELIDQIFVPFYTTKSHGTGIGLSISRQIMHAHRGEIRVNSQPNEGTVFELILPASA